jgi:hypothetical protein
VVLSSCLSGSKNLHDEDASGKDRVEFEFLVGSSGGHTSKDLLISRTDEAQIPYSVVITNCGTRPQEVSWSQAPGSDKGGMVSVEPGESQVVVISTVKTISGTVLAGLTSEKNRLKVVVTYESPLPEGTRVRARMVWADGP